MPRITEILRSSVKKFGKLSYISNIPQSYIDREKGTVPKKVFGNRFGAPDIIKWKIDPEDYAQTSYRPWEFRAKQAQREAEYKRRFGGTSKNETKVDRIQDDKWFFFIGDRVEVRVGKDKGKQGHIVQINRDMNLVWVDGLNIKYEYYGGKKSLNYQGYMTIEEQPLDVAKGEVQLVDSDSRVTEAEWKFTKEGEPIRVSTTTGREIRIPKEAFQTQEYISPATYQENEKDTPVKEVLKKNHEVQPLMTFEEEIMKEYNIPRDGRQYGKTYFY